MLRHWIPADELNLRYLIVENPNPKSLLFLENGVSERVKYSSEYKTIYIEDLVDRFQRHDWITICPSPHKISLLEKFLDRVNWHRLSENPAAMHILEQEQYVNRQDFYWLSKNENAIHLLEQNRDKINWPNISSNRKAVHLMEERLDLIHWHYTSSNPSCVHLCYKYPEKIEWYVIYVLFDIIKYLFDCRR